MTVDLLQLLVFPVRRVILNHDLHTVAEVQNRLEQGKILLLAGDENLLRQLPRGRWIGGTIPYFMTREGGICTKELIHVTELPPFVIHSDIIFYDSESIAQVYKNAPENGFSFIITPAECKTHFAFSLHAPMFENFAVHPLIGWVSGTHLDDWGRVKPKIFNGLDQTAFDDGAIVMHITLPANKVAEIGIINMFEQGTGDIITFLKSGFSAKYACINGVKEVFADYIDRKSLDKRIPLVANHHGTMINTAFKETYGPDGKVYFYNAVFDSTEYRHAKPVENYSALFTKSIIFDFGTESVFSCNCTLNYIYSEVEDRRFGYAPGPTTFGEIAYQTLNQTLIYLRIITLHNGQFRL